MEAHLSGSLLGLRAQAVPLFQLFNGLRSGREMPVQTPLHGLRCCSPDGGQSLKPDLLQERPKRRGGRMKSLPLGQSSLGRFGAQW